MEQNQIEQKKLEEQDINEYDTKEFDEKAMVELLVKTCNETEQLMVKTIIKLDRSNKIFYTSFTILVAIICVIFYLI